MCHFPPSIKQHNRGFKKYLLLVSHLQNHVYKTQWTVHGKPNHRHAVAKICWWYRAGWQHMWLVLSWFTILYARAVDCGWRLKKLPWPLTCCTRRKWDPAGRPETSHGGACAASLPWSWWVWPQGPQWPPHPQWGGAPPGPHWLSEGPGPGHPAPNRIALTPPPASWSM